VLECFGGQTPALLRAQAFTGQRVCNPGVVSRVDHNSDGGEILGGGAEHGGSPNVDVLQGVIQRDVGIADGFDERVKVHHHQVDSINAVAIQLGHVVWRVPPRQQPAVNRGMQRLDPAFQYFRRAGHLGYLAHGNAGLSQAAVGSAGADQLVAGIGETPAQLFDTRFVIDAQ
jgi:hypothetical protein